MGAGGDVTPGNGHVLIDDIRPRSDLQGVTVSAREDETGTSDAWYVQAFAICALPPPGLQRMSATSPLNSSNKGVTATCPGGKRLLGTGGDISSSNGQVLFDDLRPDSPLTSAVFRAVEDETGNSAAWSLTAYAICANPVGGLQRVSAVSGLSSSSSKVRPVSCPAGKQVVGGGGDINSSNGQVVFDALFPDAALTRYTAAAFEDDTGIAGNWSLTAYAICVATADRVAVTVPSNSETAWSTTAGCPTGKRATGIGGEITGAFGRVIFDDLVPGGSPPTQSVVTGWEDQTATASNWSLSAYAICATPPPGLARIPVTSVDNSDGVKDTTAPCPGGKRVVGAGGEISGGLGQVAMSTIQPLPNLQSVRVIAFEDTDGTAANWSVTAYAVCATPPPGLQLVTTTTQSDSDEVGVAKASCPATKQLLGTGAEIPGAGTQVVLDGIRPNAALTNLTVTGIESPDAPTWDWTLSAYAICANL